MDAIYPMSQLSLSESAYRTIRQRLSSGQLSSGVEISEPSLARQLGMSRTPVRDAIRRLVFEGFLEQVPKRGTVVRTLGRRDIIELYELRELIEGYAAAAAARRMPPHEIDLLDQFAIRMRDEARSAGRGGDTPLTPGLAQEFLTADMAFHLLVLRAVGNRRIMEIASRYQVLSRLFGHPRKTATIRVVAWAYAAHRRIARCIRRRDAEGARRHMAAHIAQGRRFALQRFMSETSDAATPVEENDLWSALPDEVLKHLKPDLDIGMFPLPPLGEGSASTRSAR